MIDSKTKTELSPLDQIRQTEAEVTRQIAAARKEAEATISKAKAQAAQIKQRANEAGTRQGQALYKEIISAAEEEAHAIIAEADLNAQELRQKGEKRMEEAIRLAIAFVIGMQAEDLKFYER